MQQGNSIHRQVLVMFSNLRQLGKVVRRWAVALILSLLTRPMMKGKVFHRWVFTTISSLAQLLKVVRRWAFASILNLLIRLTQLHKGAHL